MHASDLLDVLAGGDMDLRPGSDGPGIIAFFIVAALVVVCVFLYRSMRKQIGKIDLSRSDHGGDEPPAAGPPANRSAGSEPT